jgi:predicted alpha/beta-hydrolase family hydrolase
VTPGGTTVRELDTPHGPARVHAQRADGVRAALVLGHGAGGGVAARDLVAAADEARSHGVSVMLVEQPYRVAGRRSPPPAAHLDTAWRAVVDDLRGNELAGLPIMVGGRSSGARVACRTAGDVGAVAVLCLAFPLVPPARRSGASPVSRLPEQESVRVPTLVVQGSGDRFGIPPAAPGRTVAVVPGDHSLRSGLAELRAAVGAWLEEVV